MVRIVLDEVYVLQGDACQWILCKKAGKQLKALSYWTSLEGVLDEYVGVFLRTSHASSMIELLTELKAVKSRLNVLLLPLDKPFQALCESSRQKLEVIKDENRSTDTGENSAATGSDA